MSPSDCRPDSHDPLSPDRIDDAVAEYVDRLNDGDDLDPFEILAAHPEHGAEILRRVEAYAELERGDTEPLGTLGDYTLRRQIGRGGMGVVYEAWENSMDRAVALKVLPSAVAADERALQRFVREAQTAGQLSHPNVVGVHAMGVKDQIPYYAMELVDGETLAEILCRIRDTDENAETPFGLKYGQDFFGRLGAVFADVADGLQQAHSKGVTHRDIKPSNLILDGEGRLRILDFGLARFEGQESLTLSGDFVGTPLYMSPEQARRRRIPVDHRTDVYSLGATMYEAICGRPPFRGKDHADTLSQIVERDPVAPRKVNPRVPQDLETIVLKCLRKDAGDRYGTAEALGQDLRRFVQGDPIEARPRSDWERLSSWLRRHRIALLGATAGVIILCALAWLGAALSEARREAVQLKLTDQIETHLDAGEWSDAVALGRQVVTGDETSAEPYLLFGKALKYHLARGEGSSDSELELEFLKVARRAWKLAPEERDARYLMRAAREVALRTSVAIPSPESSSRIHSALRDLSALFPPQIDRGEVIVEDFTRDPNLWDGRPFVWHVAQGSGEFEPSPEGDGLDLRPAGRNSCMVAGDDVISGDVRIGLRAVVRRADWARVGLWFHGGPHATGYIGRVVCRTKERGGSYVEIHKWRRGKTVLSERGEPVSLTPGEEMQLELSSIGSRVEFRVWQPRPGEERRSVADAVMNDNEYRIGRVGFGGTVPQPDGSKSASLRLRSFSVEVSP